METQPTEDYIIPDEDSIFSLLPDGREVTFPDLGGLRNHVQEEIAAWTIEAAKKYSDFSAEI